MSSSDPKRDEDELPRTDQKHFESPHLLARWEGREFIILKEILQKVSLDV